MRGVVPIFADPTADPVSGAVIGAAIAVHTNVGPGMLESVCQACLQRELSKRGIPFSSAVRLPLIYEGEVLDHHFRLDLLVDQQLIVELKSADALLPVHRAQLITYLRMGQCRRGLLINFNVARLSQGIVRVVL